MRLLKLLLVACVCFASTLHSQTDPLFTSAPSFSDDDHLVSASFFHWYASNGGQLSGPWMPLEGRENWTGLTDWWKTQIKQVMMANIDVLNVHLINDAEIRRELFFEALYELRAEGYDVPKICPFLDPLITWFNQPVIDLGTQAGKAALVDQYIRFYTQYFQRNPDAFAADYLAKIDGKLMLDTWHLFLNFTNVDQLSRTDVTSRLAAAFPGRAEFNNDIYMITPALNNPTFNFTDERTPQFEINEYYYENTFNNRKTVQLKAGYWDQNVRTPGDFLPRDGGVHYKDAWAQIDATVDRVYVESWNEYDEGTGIYAGSTGSPVRIASNTNTDTWSTDNDPYEYIRTTAAGAALFNNTPELDALFLAHSFPESLGAGASTTVTVTVRNEGNFSWTGAEGVSLVQLATDPVQLSYEGGTIADNANEIPVYGGIFRGRPITFNLEVTAPETAGMITTNWQMMRNGEPFGEVLTVNIEVTAVSSIVENPAKIGLSVAPNPSWEGIRVDWTGPRAERATFYDVTGRAVAGFTNVIAGQYLELPPRPGVYHLLLEIDGQRFSQRVVRF